MLETQLIDAGSPDAIESALAVLRAGGLVAFPTDTVYGLGSLVFDEAAVLSIYAAKDRPDDKAIPVLLGDASDVERVALALPESAVRLARRFWPGPLTLVVSKRPELPA